MTAICLRDQCTGCAACVSACPRRCIRMVYDEEGFLFPEIETLYDQ